jgi:ribonuclease T2
MRLRLSILGLAVALAALSLPAAADVPMTGNFVAGKACPAEQSFNRHTNPGDVRLAPNQSYALISANRTPASHYLLIVPGASPERRWVAIDCGTVGGAGTAATSPASPATAPLPDRPAKTASARLPSHYVLALSWEPAFCAGHGDKPECSVAARRTSATRLSLHGLWPDPNEYCGVAARDIAADKAGRWNALPAVALDAATRTRLAQRMPGTQSLLERHEWLKHGTCSGVDASTYFGRALDFLAAVDASPVQALLAANIGKSLSRSAIQGAFDRGFGRGAGDRIRLSCPRQNGQRQITEITIGLQGDVMGAAPLPALIAAAGPTNGGCDVGNLVAAGR